MATSASTSLARARYHSSSPLRVAEPRACILTLVVQHTPTRLVHLHGQTIADAAGDFGGEDKVPKTAITMGVGTILHAKHVVLLAWGCKKAPIVKRAIEDEISDAVPASFLREHASSIFVLDREAAAELAL